MVSEQQAPTSSYQQDSNFLSSASRALHFHDSGPNARHLGQRIWKGQLTTCKRVFQTGTKMIHKVHPNVVDKRI